MKPIIDLFNGLPTKEVKENINISLENRPSKFEVLATRDIKKDEECFMDYGDKSDIECFAIYGFIPDCAKNLEVTTLK